MNSAAGDKAQAWATGLKYDANQAYIAAMYGETLNMTPYKRLIANKTQNVELVAQYQFENGIRPSLVTNGAIVIHTQRLKSDPGGNLLS